MMMTHRNRTEKRTRLSKHLMGVISCMVAMAMLAIPGCGAGTAQSGATPVSLGATGNGQDQSDQPMEQESMSNTVTVRLFNEQGKLVGPVEVPKIEKSEEEWRASLTPEQFKILRSDGTERPFCGTLLENKEEGVYSCAGCGLPLFTSSSKFKSGTGWPSFFQPIAEGNIDELEDRSHGMVRTEINCARCDGHLGHVFNDGPRPTGLRYCVNSESLAFTPDDQLASLADPAASAPGEGRTGDDGINASGEGGRATAVFAGGCFWCVEAIFEELEGVEEVISGYAGGQKETADYSEVSTGRTGHAEAVKIMYDPSKITFEELLRVHFASHDPTQLNRQGNDVGPQYRSAIFYRNAEEKALAEAFLEDLRDQNVYDKPVVTTLEPLAHDGFFEAESYHQNFVCNNPNQGYVRAVALPKVEKIREKFKDKLKDVSPLEQVSDQQ